MNKSCVVKNGEQEIIEIVLEQLKHKNQAIRSNLKSINEAVFIDFTKSIVSENDIFEYLFEYAIKEFILTLCLHPIKCFDIDKDNFMKLLEYHRIGYQILREINQLLLYKNEKEVDLELIAKFCSFAIIDSYLKFALDKEDYSFLQKSMGGKK